MEFVHFLGSASKYFRNFNAERFEKYAILMIMVWTISLTTTIVVY